MRLSLLAPLGIAAVMGIMAADAPDANALVRRTVVTSPRGTTVITRTHRPRVAFRFRNRYRSARGAVICHTVIVNGMRVRRCR